MVEFIIKYWIEFLLGLITTALSFACKKFYKLYQSEKQHQKTKEQTAFYDDLKETIREVGKEALEGDQKLQEQINKITSGVLSIQGKNFKQDCRELLKEGREITLTEFEAIQEEHNVYQTLGGNHDGDTLFEMVVKKATRSLTD